MSAARASSTATTLSEALQFRMDMRELRVVVMKKTRSSFWTRRRRIAALAIMGACVTGILLALLILIPTLTQTTITTTTTTMTPCAPTTVGSSSNLLTASSGSLSYTCYAYEWTPLTTGAVNLTFTLRHDPNFWFLDDVSVYNGSTEMISNGGFESGSFTPGWTLVTPTGCGFGTAGYISSSSCHTGNYCYADGCNGHTDTLSQSFVATVGQSYFTSFWLKSGSIGSVISISVDIS